MISERMKIETGGIRHFACLVPEFDSGERGIGQHKGRIVVQLANSNLRLTRHPSEVVGWRLMCRCVRPGKDAPATVQKWIGEEFWTRVEDSHDHDPSQFRVYVPDELTVDVAEIEDVANAVETAWHQNHIQAWGALMEILSAYRQLQTAARMAIDTPLARADVRAEMGLGPRLADYLDHVFSAGADG